MLTDTGPVAKLYLSIIDDVIDSVRELFLDEGVEDRVLDDLRHLSVTAKLIHLVRECAPYLEDILLCPSAVQLWESKVMQSKAMEGLRKNTNPSNFVLQLPASYTQTDQELSTSVVIPGNQNIRSFPVKNNSETLATFSLPAGLAYPVQIPAGVTLQTASGQLYKVNVPVVVTQAPVGQQPATQAMQKVTEWREASAPQPAAIPPNPIPPHEVETSSVPAPSVTQPKTILPSSQEGSLPLQSTEPDFTQEENEPNPQPNLSTTASPCTQLLDFQIRREEALAQRAQSRDIDDILKEVIEEEREKAERARKLAPVVSDSQSEATPGLDLDYSYSQFSDIVQLDGPAGNSDLEEEEEVPLEENDFLGIINAEAMKALQEGNESSDGNSISSSSDGEGADELANIEEEDPLNSGDDVIEQDIPDLFDTDNVIVCQYDKIHRSKNRWKFHLKDGVMCYGGRDYVFSKAVGEAEW